MMVALAMVLVYLLIVACVLYGIWKDDSGPLDVSELQPVHPKDDIQ